MVLTAFVIPSMTGCINPTKTDAKQVLLKAGREAPLGWVDLTIYRDSTFEFTLSGIRNSDKEVYSGVVEIRNDSLFFTYADSIPRAGKTAIYNNQLVGYIDGEYPERLTIITPGWAIEKHGRFGVTP